MCGRSSASTPRPRRGCRAAVGPATRTAGLRRAVHSHGDRQVPRGGGDAAPRRPTRPRLGHRRVRDRPTRDPVPRGDAGRQRLRHTAPRLAPVTEHRRREFPAVVVGWPGRLGLPDRAGDHARHRVPRADHDDMRHRAHRGPPGTPRRVPSARPAGGSHPGRGSDGDQRPRRQRDPDAGHRLLGSAAVHATPSPAGTGSGRLGGVQPEHHRRAASRRKSWTRTPTTCSPRSCPAPRPTPTTPPSASTTRSPEPSPVPSCSAGTPGCCSPCSNRRTASGSSACTALQASPTSAPTSCPSASSRTTADGPRCSCTSTSFRRPTTNTAPSSTPT